MQITTYRTITNQTSSLKKLSNRTRIELTKKSNRTNRIRTKIESNTERIMNYELFLQP
jgi:regulator of sigma D